MPPQADGCRQFFSVVHPVIAAQGQNIFILHSIRLCRGGQQPLHCDLFCQFYSSIDHGKLPVAHSQPHKTAIPGAQDFHKCGCALLLLRGVHRHFFCQNALFRFQRTGRFRFCAQIHQQFNFRRAPPGQLFFHCIPDRIPAPEQHHGGIVLGDDHCRRVGAAYKVDVHYIPAESIAQPDGNSCRQQDAWSRQWNASQHNRISTRHTMAA